MTLLSSLSAYYTTFHRICCSHIYCRNKLRVNGRDRRQAACFEQRSVRNGWLVVYIFEIHVDVTPNMAIAVCFSSNPLSYESMYFSKYVICTPYACFALCNRENIAWLLFHCDNAIFKQTLTVNEKLSNIMHCESYTTLKKIHGKFTILVTNRLIWFRSWYFLLLAKC